MRTLARLLPTSLLALVTACAFGSPSGGGETGSGDEDDGIGPGTQPPPSTAECAESLSLVLEPVVLPPDLLIVLDRSSSMGEPLQPSGFVRKWDIVIDALIDVTNIYLERVHFGLSLFPSQSASCGAGSIDIAPGPYSGKNFAQDLDDMEPGGAGTPIGATLDNALAHFESTEVNPYGRYIVLATDGLPTCTEYADDDAVEAVERLSAAGIVTYVVGYAFEGDDAVLDDMAQAGGTGSYYPASSSFELLNALEGITKEVSVVSCEYTLENGPNQPTDLIITINGQTVPYDPDHQNGFDYDVVSQKLTFYGEFCSDLRIDINAQVEADYCQDVD